MASGQNLIQGMSLRGNDIVEAMGNGLRGLSKIQSSVATRLAQSRQMSGPPPDVPPAARLPTRGAWLNVIGTGSFPPTASQQPRFFLWVRYDPPRQAEDNRVLYFWVEILASFYHPQGVSITRADDPASGTAVPIGLFFA